MSELERLESLNSFPYIPYSENLDVSIEIKLTRYSDAWAAGERDSFEAIFICPCETPLNPSIPFEYFQCDNCGRKLTLEEAGAIIGRYELHLKRLQRALFERIQKEEG
mgnify:FL=1